jgi:hypothetical protein
MGLDEKALKRYKAWTFEPAQKDGKPVAVLIRIAVSFRLGNAPGAGFSPALQDLRRMDEERRRLEDRVYQVQGTAPPPVCNQNRRNDDASFSLPELKGDVSKYHLNAIKFTNNKTLTNVEALRKLFPLRDGEPLDTVKLSEGLRNLKQAYGSQGFAAFSSVVQSTVNEKDHSVSVQVKCDEGRQFYVDHINLVGLDEHTFEEVKKNLFIKPATYTTKVSLNSRCVRILA